VIVGAGLSGAVMAERHANLLNHRVLIVETREHIGGNVYDYIDEESGLRVSKYGAHLFHTKSDEVWDYVNKFSEWIPWHHKVYGTIEDKYFPVPININTVNILMGENLKDEN
jgi:UDP-galactopyranose mutase